MLQAQYLKTAPHDTKLCTHNGLWFIIFGGSKHYSWLYSNMRLSRYDMKIRLSNTQNFKSRHTVYKQC